MTDAVLRGSDPGWRPLARLRARLTPQRLRMLLAVLLMPFAGATAGVAYVGLLTALRHQADIGLLLLGLLGLWAVTIFGTLVLMPVLALPAALLALALRVGLRALGWQGALAHLLAGAVTGGGLFSLWGAIVMPQNALGDALHVLAGGALGGAVAALAFWWVARPDAQDAAPAM